jgi:hypothetical protein
MVINMKVEKIELIRGFMEDDSVDLKINNVEIATANYDEHGSYSYYIMNDVAEGLSKLFDVPVEEVFIKK